MTNPYKTPESDVNQHTNLPRRKIGWKVFFWFYIVLEVLSVLSMLWDSSESWLDVTGEMIIYGGVLTGIFGFAYNKRILFWRFWAYWIPLAVFWDIYSITSLDWSALYTPNMLYALGFTLLLGLPVWILQYTALIKYAFRSKEIWS